MSEMVLLCSCVSSSNSLELWNVYILFFIAVIFGLIL